MFFLIPISHDRMDMRRWPWVTAAIIAINIAVHVAVTLSVDQDAVDTSMLRALEYHAAHPELSAKAPLAGFESRLKRVGARLPALGRSRPASGDPRVDAAREREAQARRQQTLDDLCEQLAAAMHASPAFRWGYLPSPFRPLTLLTYQFLHGGWEHLLFNMWFLWLLGCYVEDAWGRAFFGLFYLGAGVFAAVFQQLGGGDPNVPMIGASGAIAGVMGAFLVRFFRAKIRFYYILWPIRRGTFSSPAFVMLPLWLAGQVTAVIMDTQGNVAYLAHVGGFLFGFVVALVLRSSAFEEKIGSAIERELSAVMAPELRQAGKHMRRAEYAAAILLLDKYLGEHPDDVEAHLLLARAGRGLRSPRVEGRGYAGALGACDAEDLDAALQVFRQAMSRGLHQDLPRELVLALAQELAAQQRPVDAAELRAAVQAEGDPS